MLHRVHPSALPMMECQAKQEYHWWHMKHVHSTDDTELDRDLPCSFG